MTPSLEAHQTPCEADLCDEAVPSLQELLAQLPAGDEEDGEAEDVTPSLDALLADLDRDQEAEESRDMFFGLGTAPNQSQPSGPFGDRLNEVRAKAAGANGRFDIGAIHLLGLLEVAGTEALNEHGAPMLAGRGGFEGACSLPVRPPPPSQRLEARYGPPPRREGMALAITGPTAEQRAEFQRRRLAKGRGKGRQEQF
eukprot:gnl/TRDRNA2_/TRDRNA2_165881_c0_seq1.p2 gnl/TRDRNA2_/TRDRNA2_165881_c0~~gnl/TRDRNA2_/TRDRNA2_165881_c0_seq1.p2  ORF type:complete len:223 (-),score=54.86 gnl/TRDRNA2_/TRDRNA2_165881_c0_seq1:102-695(-)